MSGRERAVTVSRVEFDVDWPPGHVASYLIECEEPTLVDAGMPGPDCRETLDAALSDRGYTLPDIEHLVLTHPHIDHIGLVTDIVDAAAPTVHAPAGVRDRFDREPADLADRVGETAREAGLSGDAHEEAVDMAVRSLERNRELLPPDAVDHWLEPGRVTVGTTPVEAVHTPGHQADHLALAVDLGEERALLAGDMAIEPFRPVAIHTGLDSGVEDAIGAFYTALDRLDALDVARVYPGHGPVHTEFRATIARDRDSLDRMLDRTVEAVDEGVDSAVAMANRRAGDRGTAYIIAEVVGALRHLDRVGRLDSSVVDGVRRYRVA